MFSQSWPEIAQIIITIALAGGSLFVGYTAFFAGRLVAMLRRLTSQADEGLLLQTKLLKAFHDTIDADTRTIMVHVAGENAPYFVQRAAFRRATAGGSDAAGYALSGYENFLRLGSPESALLPDDDEGLLDIVVDYGFSRDVPAREVAAVSAALDRVFRIWCREHDLPFDGLDLVAAGPGSWYDIFRPRRRRGTARPPRDYQRAGYRVAIATLVATVGMWSLDKATDDNPSGSLQEMSHEMREAARELRDAINAARASGAGDVTFGGAGARCTVPAPQRGEALPRRPLLTSIEFDAISLGGTIGARTDFCPHVVPIDDQRAFAAPLSSGIRYQATARLVPDENGTLFVIQLRDATRIES